MTRSDQLGETHGQLALAHSTDSPDEQAVAVPGGEVIKMTMVRHLHPLDPRRRQDLPHEPSHRPPHEQRVRIRRLSREAVTMATGDQRGPSGCEPRFLQPGNHPRQQPSVMAGLHEGSEGVLVRGDPLVERTCHGTVEHEAHRFCEVSCA